MPGALPPHVQHESLSSVRLFVSPVVGPWTQLGGAVLPEAGWRINLTPIFVVPSNHAIEPGSLPTTLKFAVVQTDARSKTLPVAAEYITPGLVSTLTESSLPPAMAVTLILERL